MSCLRDAPNAAGRETADWRPPLLEGIKAIDPGMGPRNRSLNTRMGKKELAPTAKCNCSDLAASGADSVQTVEIEFHRHGSAFHDHLLKNSGGLVRVVRNCLLLRSGISGARVGRAEKKKELGE